MIKLGTSVQKNQRIIKNYLIEFFFLILFVSIFDLYVCLESGTADAVLNVGPFPGMGLKLD